MGLTLLYLALTYLRPWEFIQELAPYRLAFWTGNLGLIVSVCRFAIRGPHTLLRAPEPYLLVFFSLILIFSPVLAEGWLGGAMEAFTDFMTALIGCILIVLNVDTLRRAKIVMLAILLFSLVLVAQGAYSYHTGWEFERFVMEQRLDAFNEFGVRDSFGRLRAFGYLNDPNDLAQALIITLPWLWPAWRQGSALRNFCLVIAPSMFLLYGVYLTRSRGGMLSLLCVIMVRLREKMTRFRNTLPIAAAFVLGVAMLALGVTGGRDLGGDSSSEGRLEAWRHGVEMLMSHPLTGVGFGNFADHHIRAAHNSFVHCFAELGFTGYFCWLGLLLFALIRLTGIADSAGDDPEAMAMGQWARALRVSFFGFLTGAFFLSRTYTPTLYLLIGLAIAMHQISLQTEHPPASIEVPTVLGLTAGAALASIATVFVLGHIG